MGSNLLCFILLIYFLSARTNAMPAALTNDPEFKIFVYGQGKLIITSVNCTVDGLLKNVTQLPCSGKDLIFTPNSKIDNSGFDASQQTFKSCAETGGYGLPGYPGAQGISGGDAVSLSVAARRIIGKFWVIANGGDGGPGQCGGQGGQGAPGQKGADVVECSRGCGGLGTCESCQVPGNDGSPGKTGGNGAMGGQGGTGGQGGDVVINIMEQPEPENIDISVDAGDAGPGGAGGEPGLAGVGGAGGIGWYSHACNFCTNGIESRPCSLPECTGKTGEPGQPGLPGTVGPDGKPGHSGHITGNNVWNQRDGLSKSVA